MSDQKDQYYKGLFWGTILGAAAGAVAGILFAPDKGSETRAKLKEKINELIENGLELSAETLANFQNQDTSESIFTESIHENDAKKTADDIVNEAKVKAAKLIAEANTLLKEAKDASGLIASKPNGFKS
ncbi:MAG: YtxH domain-containing protein [Chloroherpetonaceae bacterium]|nr:YtxH domain-containing protein [Chloroherpetonaceae bacterium]